MGTQGKALTVSFMNNPGEPLHIFKVFGREARGKDTFSKRSPPALAFS